MAYAATVSSSSTEPVYRFTFQEGPQRALLECSAHIAITGGAAGGGKTYGLLLDTLAHIKNPDAGVVLFRRTYPQIMAEGALWDEAGKMYPPVGGISNKTDTFYEFPSGMQVKFAHMQHPDNRYQWDGAQIPILMFDQLEHFTVDQFWYLTSRNRSATCGFRPYIRATCNPVPPEDQTGGWLHDLLGWWINPETGFAIVERSGILRWFVRIDDEMIWADSREDLEAQHPEVPPRSFTFIPSTLSDNVILMENDPAYLGALMALPRYERERLLLGNWLVKADAGLVFDRADFNLLAAVPNDVVRWVRYWDKAGTPKGIITAGRQKKSAHSAGVLMGERANGDIVVADVVRGQWSYLKREEMILQTAALDHDRYGNVEVWLEQEPGSGGQESAQRSVKMLRGYNVHTETASGSKLERASNYSAQAEAGNVYVLRAEWNDVYLVECHRFDGATGVMDQVDASSGAFNKLTLEKEQVQGVVMTADAERRRQARQQ